jgi:hypothetical protein
MRSSLRVLLIGYILLGVIWSGSWAQDTPQESRKVGLNLGFSAWPNNCDIPSGGQDTGIEPSFGPFFSLSFGKWRVGGTFFVGNFGVAADHGIELDSNRQPQFSNEGPRERGFTSQGETQRIDLDLNVGYEFSRYARVSLSFILNRHEADVTTFWFPVRNEQGEIELPTDQSRSRLLAYTDNQFWVGTSFGGSIPVETVSTRFSIFYNSGLLLLAAESGDGVFEQPVGTLNETGPRTSYTDENGQLAFPPRDLGSRSFGDNFGITLNAGLGFQLTNDPAVVIFGGYNVKFFQESESRLIDHSIFRGPFFGASVNVF